MPIRCLFLCVLIGACNDSSGEPDAAVPMDLGVDVPGDVGAPRSALAQALSARLDGDRTGACIRALRIDGERVEEAVACADEARTFDANTHHEIGSISKTMTGFLIADLVRSGELSLDDPLALHVPVEVPERDGQPIRIRHLLTHTSGLPSLPTGWEPSDVNDPYASLQAERALELLPTTELAGEPGAAFAYSNFGFMLLSYIASAHAGGTFEQTLEETLLRPAGMAAGVQVGDGVRIASAHLPNGTETPRWRFAPELAGVGGVHASLQAMQRYAELVLGRGDSELVATMSQALEAVAPSEMPRMGFGWFLVPVGARTLYFHNGGTGGSSSSLFVDREGERAVVLLCDTSWTNVSGLDELALHLLDPALAPALPPRRQETAPLTTISGLAGRYMLAGLSVELSERDGSLVATVGADEIVFRYDNYGDFYPVDFDALLTPVEQQGAEPTFDWTQGGGVTRAQRL